MTQRFFNRQLLSFISPIGPNQGLAVIKIVVKLKFNSNGSVGFESALTSQTYLQPISLTRHSE